MPCSLLLFLLRDTGVALLEGARVARLEDICVVSSTSATSSAASVVGVAATTSIDVEAVDLINSSYVLVLAPYGEVVGPCEEVFFLLSVPGRLTRFDRDG